ncbi:MAG TPA: phosphoribosylformylglycinamidine synthase subunit PurQ [bacterium]|nr:phosphoribosylformylglycinamidine synthase subunit PurQ [bacterium]
MDTLILSGFGTNCERETRYACEQAGADYGAGAVEVRHIGEIYTSGLDLERYGFLILIGGFLDGDDLGAGRACANRFRYRLLPDHMGGGTFLQALQRFIAAGRLVLGVCNGFQVLVKLGLLPALRELDNGAAATGSSSPSQLALAQQVTLTTNARGRFEDRWVHLRGDSASPCVFTRGINFLELPVRHGEGRLLAAEPQHLAMLVERHLAPLRYCLPEGSPTEDYPANPNGSPLGIAALCNPTGTVMGLMPHPEAFNHYTNHPRWMRQRARQQQGDGLRLFRNAYAYLSVSAYTD